MWNTGVSPEHPLFYRSLWNWCELFVQWKCSATVRWEAFRHTTLGEVDRSQRSPKDGGQPPGNRDLINQIEKEEGKTILFGLVNN